MTRVQLIKEIIVQLKRHGTPSATRGNADFYRFNVGEKQYLIMDGTTGTYIRRIGKMGKIGVEEITTILRSVTRTPEKGDPK